jgi:exodeoxyribonuclease V beta subunit
MALRAPVRQFPIFDPALDPLGSYFLEASAGTGKTFALEHLVVRIVLQGVTIDRILVVTFTHAATRELRQRMRLNLERSLVQLESRKGAPYLQQIDPQKAGLLLEDALATFEEARIQTIHGFCFDLLREFSLEGGLALSGREKMEAHEQMEVVRDLLRIRTEVFSSGQLERVLAGHGGDLERLGRRLLQVKPVFGQPFKEQLRAFGAAMRALTFSAAQCREAFARLAPSFVGLCNRSGEVKAEHRNNADQFASILERGDYSAEAFDQLIREGVVLLDLMAHGKYKRGARTADDDPLLVELVQRLDPVLSAARDRSALEGQLAASLRQLLEARLTREEWTTPDRLLEKTWQFCQESHFCTAVRARLGAIIVDEFQDTDPLQWAILQRLFVGHLPFTVVGDPKQSIYAFRRADIYSYLQAREQFEEPNRFSLATNYRSRPQLVAGLNHLFSGSPGWLALPALSLALPYEPVQVGIDETGPLADQPAIQFIAVDQKRGHDEEALFSFVADEILDLAAAGMPFSASAVLVTDRFQAQRLHRHLANRKIPAQTTRGAAFSESPMMARLREAVLACMDPSCAGPALIALFGWTGERWVAAARGEESEHLNDLQRLQAILREKGVVAFTSALCSHPQVYRHLLLQPDGLAALHVLHQVAAAVADAPWTELVSRLADLETEEQIGSDAGPLRPLAEVDAVTIQTIFASKGLEYGVVFALAAGERTRSPESDLVELDAEKSRLLYVALTRAKERVYVPLYLAPSPPAPGTISPLERLIGNDPALLDGFVIRQLPSTPSKREAVIPALELHPPLPHRVTLPLRLRQSFTSLVQRESKKEEIRGSFSEGGIPHGAELGRVVHQILERLPLNRRYDHPEELLPFVQQLGCARQLTQLLWNALHTPLNGFCVADVAPNACLRECEFLFNVEGESFAGATLKEGSVTGAIDLLLCHDDRYYLVDWKTNWLGADPTPQRLQQIIREEQYDLQAALYQEALRRYLRLVDPRPFDQIFGGTYYLFLQAGISHRIDLPGEGSRLASGSLS